jgi:hypothetical protein
MEAQGLIRFREGLALVCRRPCPILTFPIWENLCDRGQGFAHHQVLFGKLSADLASHRTILSRWLGFRLVDRLRCD